jgi:hypothetical protein
MTNIRVSRDVSTETIRQQLGSFSLFSTVEARTDTKDSKVTVLHEVKLGERIKRFFSQSSGVRNQQVWLSQQALQSLALQRPEIHTLLGQSVWNKQDWSASELRDALKIKASILKQAKDGSGLQVGLDQPGQVGVANAKVSQIVADSKITWKLSPIASKGQFEITKPTDHGTAEISVRRTDEPSEDELRSAYKTALENAKGHVVIAPVDDIAHGKRAKIVQQEGDTKKTVEAHYCSDTSLKLLLEAIDEAKQNSHITAVTIACDEYPDKTISTRLVQQQAIRRASAASEVSAEFSIAGMERGRFQPTSEKQAPGQAGMHFVKNSALSLHANRTIVPGSIVSAKFLDAIGENEAAKLPKIDTSRLIAFDDGFLDSHQYSSAQRMGERMSALLAGFTGKVVISPPHCDDDQLLAIVGAVNEACANNQHLSVTFAVDDEAQRKRLTHAYATLRINIAEQRELHIDDDEDEEPKAYAKLLAKVDEKRGLAIIDGNYEQPVFHDELWRSL